jgi:hypothetical protein
LKSCFPIATLLNITIWVKIRLFCHTQTGPGIGIGNGQSDNPYKVPDIDPVYSTDEGPDNGIGNG